jgi:hypothetical protein
MIQNRWIELVVMVGRPASGPRITAACVKQLAGWGYCLKVALTEACWIGVGLSSCEWFGSFGMDKLVQGS